MEWIYILILGIFFPLFPLSFVFSYISKNRKLRFPVYLTFPVIGYILYRFFELKNIPEAVIIVAFLTSAFYAFRSLYVVTFERWVSFIYISFLSLIWSFIAGGTLDLLMSALFAISSVPALIIVSHMETRYGSSHFLAVSSIHTARKLAFSFNTSSLILTGFPFSISFISILLGLWEFNILKTLIISLIWFFWGWSLHNVINTFVAGERKENIMYVDLPLKEFIFIQTVILGIGIISLIIISSILIF